MRDVCMYVELYSVHAYLHTRMPSELSAGSMDDNQGICSALLRLLCTYIHTYTCSQLYCDDALHYFQFHCLPLTTGRLSIVSVPPSISSLPTSFFTRAPERGAAQLPRTTVFSVPVSLCPSTRPHSAKPCHPCLGIHQSSMCLLVLACASSGEFDGNSLEAECLEYA